MSREAMKLALEALETVAADVKTTPTAYEAQRQAITALREALVNEALDKKAENARELGLDYEPIQCPICKAEDSPYPKCGCVTYVEQSAQQEPVAYDKTEINCFAQDLYDQKMREGKRGHYESMFHVIHQCIKKVSPPAQQEPVFAIRLLTNQCFALAQERDELQKQVWRYEKNGVTCQTYRHKVDASCSECNVHEVYASPPAQRTWVGLTDEEVITMSRYDLEYAALIGEVERKLKEKNT